MRTLKKKVLFTAVLTIVLAVAIFLGENVFTKFQPIVTRNTYGEGKKTEKYALTIEDEVEDAVLELEIEERAYTQEETQEVYAEVSVQEEKISLEEPQMKIEQEQKIESVIKTEPQIENKEETSTEPEKTKVKLLDNPLPLPKKHVKKEMNYAFEPSADQMHYDLNNYRVDDDYDLKTNI